MQRIRHTYLAFFLLLALLAAGGSNLVHAERSETPGRFTDEIRVAIMDHLSLNGVAITPRAASLRLMADGESWSLKAGELVRFEHAGGRVAVTFGSKRIKATSISLELEGPGAFDVDGGSSSYTRTYTGSLDVSVKSSGTGISIINRVPIEDYVASVVGAEYGLNDLEGAKAMAVVARTYALHALKQGKNLLDSERSQVYQGLQKANAAARQAAQSTAGEVLTWKGDLIEAVYSASNGGRTATNESVWGTSSIPYLRSRRDPYDADVSPHAKWTWEMDEEKVEKALSDAFGLGVRSIRVAETAKDGRVTRVELKSRKDSKTISGSSFRAALARSFGAMTVKSTYFDLDEKRDRYVFSGRGFGHGVGLSQWGAHAMALDGRSYEDILDFYYDGVRLESIPHRASLVTDVTLAGLVEAEASTEIGGWTAPNADSMEPSMDSNASNMSISRASSEESSASLETVSNASASSKEKKSEISSESTSAEHALSAETIWGASKQADEDDKPVRKKQRRSGW